VKAIAWLKASAGFSAATAAVSAFGASASPPRADFARPRRRSTVASVSGPSRRVITRPSAEPSERTSARNRASSLIAVDLEDAAGRAMRMV
jgi:hypothetical protein